MHYIFTADSSNEKEYEEIDRRILLADERKYTHTQEQHIKDAYEANML